MKPSIYCAGKIAPNDFRHDLIPRLRQHVASRGPLDCARFTYVGPFFQSCDHCCAHGPGAHGDGLGNGEDSCSSLEPTTAHQVWTRNMAALRQSTAVFAYIDADDAYGTLVEIGAARALRIPCCVLFAPNVDAKEMWYAAQGGVTKNRVRRENLPARFNAFLLHILRGGA